MAYDVELANRLRESLANEADVSERAMFGGLAFMVNGHLAVSASSRGGILLRIDPHDGAALLTRPHVEAFVMRGRAMDGWLRVEHQGLEGDGALETWVARGVAYARSYLPNDRKQIPKAGWELSDFVAEGARHSE